jgi:hypothetical protein
MAPDVTIVRAEKRSFINRGPQTGFCLPRSTRSRTFSSGSPVSNEVVLESLYEKSRRRWWRGPETGQNATFPTHLDSVYRPRWRSRRCSDHFSYALRRGVLGSWASRAAKRSRIWETQRAWLPSYSASVDHARRWREHTTWQRATATRSSSVLTMATTSPSWTWSTRSRRRAPADRSWSRSEASLRAR